MVLILWFTGNIDTIMTTEIVFSEATIKIDQKKGKVASPFNLTSLLSEYSKFVHQLVPQYGFPLSATNVTLISSLAPNKDGTILSAQASSEVGPILGAHASNEDGTILSAQDEFPTNHPETFEEYTVTQMSQTVHSGLAMNENDTIYPPEEDSDVSLLFCWVCFTVLNSF